MASYELFSSMVKTFRVSSSERFPQKMWDVVGTFVAKNEKGVQTYATEQEKYYKYFKVSNLLPQKLAKGRVLSLFLYSIKSLIWMCPRAY